MLTTAEGVMTQTDRLNGDGLQEVFATNLFGHFMMVRRHVKTGLSLMFGVDRDGSGQDRSHRLRC